MSNENSKPKSGLLFSDILIDPAPSLKEFLKEKAAKDADGDILSNGLGWPKWHGVVRRKKKAVAIEKPLGQIEPNGEATTKVEILPIRRGSLFYKGSGLIPTGDFSGW